MVTRTKIQPKMMSNFGQLQHEGHLSEGLEITCKHLLDPQLG